MESARLKSAVKHEPGRGGGAASPATASHKGEGGQARGEIIGKSPFLDLRGLLYIKRAHV